MKHIGVIFWIAVMAVTLLVCPIFGWEISFGTAGLSVVLLYMSVVLAMQLGKNSTFFTIVEEGQAKGITIFERAHKCIMAYTAHRFSGELDPTNHIHSDTFFDVVRLPRNTKRPEEKNFWHLFVHRILGLDLGGLKWVGVWPFYKVYTYNFRWTSLRGQLPTGFTGETTKYEETREREIDYILVRQETYLLDLKGIEDKDLIAVDIKLVWTIRVQNPFKALFRVRNWLETSTDRLLTYIRRGFAQTTWREFQAVSDLQTNLDKILKQLEENYGVKTVGIEIIELNPPEEFKQAAERVRNAQAEADAAIHTAKSINTLAEAEKNRITAVMGTAKGLGEEGVAMKITEDLAKGGRAVIVMGAARELVKDLLGKKEG